MSVLKFFGKLPVHGVQRYACSALSCQFRIQARYFGQPASQTHPHLVQEGEVTPGISKEEYRHRRHKLVERILRKMKGSPIQDHLIIVPSATKIFMSQDIPYTFRQNTDFLYLCGFQEPDSVLVLEANASASTHKATLFVPKNDAKKELWEGPRSGVNGALELTGIQNAYSTDELGNFLYTFSCDHLDFGTWYDYQKPANLNFHLRHIPDFLKESRRKLLESPRQLIHSLRVIKSPAEVALMQKSCDIASNALREVMRYSHSGVSESHLYAKMDFECRINGAEYLAYPPVVAGGNRANTIHYVANNRMVEGGEMVLMDAGCECHGYTSDITRTWPVSGEFSSAQRDLYEALLEVQKSCIRLCEYHDLTMDQIYREMLTLIGLQLSKLGVLPKRSSAAELQMAAREFCPHHVSHYLGMDVHDTDSMSRSLALQPGMVITIEPGIYIPKTRVDVPSEFRGLGIRIEDDILITETGFHNLTERCPKDPDQIEDIVQGHA